MGRSVGGACLGFLVVLVGGIYFAYMIFDSVTGTIHMEHPETIIAVAVIIIPVLAIFGAIIGYFTSGK